MAGAEPRGGGRLARAGGVAAFVLAAAVVGAWAHLRSPNVPDPDAFYHLRAASLYARWGLGMHDFPWAAFSMLGRLSADIWYGFHVLLIPFTYLRDPLLQIKLAGAAMLTVTLCLLWWALARLGVAYSWLWPFLMLLGIPNGLWRMGMTRPHVLSTGLAVLLLSFLIRGAFWQVGAVALAMTFVHLSFFWLIPVVVAVWALVKWDGRGTVPAFRRLYGQGMPCPYPGAGATSPDEAGLRGPRRRDSPRGDSPRAPLLKFTRLRRASIAAALAGGVCGWLVRPNPVGALRLLDVQIFQLLKMKDAAVTLTFSTELAPMAPVSLVRSYGLVLLLWVGALGLSAATGFFRRLRTAPDVGARHALPLLWCSGALSVLFLVMSLLVARRTADLWSPFALVFVAAAFTGFLAACAGSAGDSRGRPYSWLNPPVGRRVVAGGAVLLLLAVGFAVDQNGQVLQVVATPPYRLAPAGIWLREHAAPGAVVVNVHWQHFAELFYWDPQARYIGGMDPIFQYAFSHQLYWKIHHLTDPAFSGFTCGAPVCTPANREDPYQVLRRDFNARYVVVSKRRRIGFDEWEQDSLFHWLARDPRFALGFADKDFAVFEVYPPSAGSSAAASRPAAR